MDLKTTSFKVSGNLKGGGWTSIYEGDSGLAEEKRGRLWLVIAGQAESEVTDRISLGREILVFLHQKYFDHTATSNFYGLKSAVEETFSNFKGKFSGLELGAVSFADNILNVGVFGGVQAGIYRAGSLSKILVSEPEQAVFASGYPRQGDIFILGTDHFFKEFENFDYSLLLKSDTQKEFSLLQKRAAELSESSKLAGILIFFQTEITEFRNLGLKEEKNNTVNRRQLFPPWRKQFNFRRRKKVTGLPDRKVYVRSSFTDLEEAGSRRKSFLTALFLFFFILAAAFFGIKEKERRAKKAVYEAKILSITNKIDEAKKMAANDPEKSRELFWQSKEIVTQLENEGSKGKKLEELMGEIKSVEEEVLKEFRVNPTLFIDLSLLSQDFKVDKLVADSTNLLALDFAGKRVVKVAFGTKKTELALGPGDFDSFQDAALYQDKVFVLTSTGFFEAEDNQKVLFRNDFGDDAWVYEFAGNVYVLDKNAGRIYRLSPTTDGFSLPQIWTAEGINLDFEKAQSWTIDGFIWVLLADGELLRFSRGVPTKVVLKGVFPSLALVKAIYSNEELDSLYVLDSQEGRIVVFDKEGNYRAQYFADELKKTSSFVVSEAEKEIVFAGEEGKLYSIELKHLK